MKECAPMQGMLTRVLSEKNCGESHFETQIIDIDQNLGKEHLFCIEKTEIIYNNQIT